MAKHTPEPWRWDGDHGYITGGPDEENPDGYVLLGMTPFTDNDAEDEANALRIVQCVNACAGIEGPQEAIATARKALEIARDNANVVMRSIYADALSALSPNIGNER